MPHGPAQTQSVARTTSCEDGPIASEPLRSRRALDETERGGQPPKKVLKLSRAGCGASLFCSRFGLRVEPMRPRPDVHYTESFVPDADPLFEMLVHEVRWDERMRARKTASFGVPYNYSGMEYPPAAFLPALEDVRLRVAKAVGWSPNNCLLNLYPDGVARMGMHADETDQLELGTGIAIVSLGAARSIVFQHNEQEERFEYGLNPGSLLLMSTASQTSWRHGIPKKPGAGPRISATFRRLASG